MAISKKPSMRGAQDLPDLKLYTLVELVPVLGVSHASLLTYVKSGRLYAQKLAGKWRVRPCDVERFLENGIKRTDNIQK